MTNQEYYTLFDALIEDLQGDEVAEMVSTGLA